MRDDRAAFLLKKQEMGLPLTDDERRELAETPEAVGERNADGSWAGQGPMIVPRRPTGSYEDQLRQFAAMMYTDGHAPTDAEIDAFVTGKPVGTAHDQAPATHDDDPPPVDQQPPAPVTSPNVAAVADPVPVSAFTPQAATGDDDLIEVHDPSYPHDPPKLIRRSVWEKQQRKQRINAAKAIRRAPDAGGRTMSF